MAFTVAPEGQVQPGLLYHTDLYSFVLKKWLCPLGGLALMAAVLSGCASYAPDAGIVGLSRDQVVARLGAADPEAAAQVHGRLDFLRGPMGKHTYFVYFDDQGKAVRFEQVLTEERFARMVPDMSVDDVVLLIGRSRSTFGLARNRGFVWSYRYENPLCQWFQVEFTSEGKVRSAGYSKPPECRVGRIRAVAF